MKFMGRWRNGNYDNFIHYFGMKMKKNRFWIMVIKI